MGIIKPPTDKQYGEARIDLIAGFAPESYPCKKCGWPVLSGYCCGTCGDGNPSEKDAEPNKQ